jgi:hypothetical protein
VNEIGSTPARLTSPAVGAMPTSALLPRGAADRDTGLGADADRREADVTETPVPPLEPPGSRVRSYGAEDLAAERTEALVAEGQFVHVGLEKMIAPASRSRRITVASRGGKVPPSAMFRTADGRSLTSMLSFTAIGMPWSGLRRPLRRRSRRARGQSRERAG